MSRAGLHLSGVACARGGRLLFRGVDLAMEPGGSALLKGPNGIGKSSLIRICAGLLRATAGTVARHGRVAMTDERLALDMEQPLEAALRFWARLDAAAPMALDAAMAAMALEPLRQVPVRMLSTGQRKRAALARVIASGAPIWLLDEPGNGLDEAALDLLGQAVAGHLAKGGMVVAASHQPLPLASPVVLAMRDHAWAEEEA
ncbi:heme ABC exporter ATP-binding protein CcmA [Sphingobium indicum]|uniref:Cytochrome C biogenesis protein CcmA n=2 Tax=Sphingobium indicum TaxID=332055 RepID=A0A1L5BK76_SPHIB|nr:heme ABC exporter ATP-binding protein CcmA [Sphingobium indicum]EPR15311.1 cytochrome C biogenesis protein CcmA [Sphingobium indicum IP26]KEY99167.1 cytochrome C biogenesis protein CcmA [Sphingomonas sp. BHC-A]APL93222.1 cytochrome C biogenesis protein CcmA [Sphingobium indicum B90A]NYI22133.1 heme exporter protein A [Sphingobium indicum]RYM03129.1 heme ABC exporter ATP-binding protein CcmA [Sphingobium indicum]